MKYLILFLVAIVLISGCTQSSISDETQTITTENPEVGISETKTLESAKLNKTSLDEQPKQKPKGNECQGTEIKFDYPPVNLEKTLVFQPLGLMTGNHITPIDHHYFQNFDNNKPNIEVYSPGDGTITNIGHMPGAPKEEDFRLIIQHTCTVSSIYIHIHTLSDRLKEYDPGNGYTFPNIPVKAGEIIGYYATNVDYNLVDEEITLSGFLVPEHYEGEPWKIHVPNTYDYFNEPIKTKLIEKSLRTIEPINGKIDYDIDGRLVGNWFLEGTGGYKGTKPEKYWSGHLSIVYDAYNPETIVISIAGYNGKDSEQFAVKGNKPNPVDISKESGIIKYELVNYDYITPDGDFWDRKSLVKGITTKIDDNVQGIVLVQIIDERKIKFEAFPSKTKNRVSGFTENAKIYER